MHSKALNRKKVCRNRPIERASECHSPLRIYNSLLRMRAIHELKRDLTGAISNWIIMNQFFCPYCFCNGDCVVFDHSFYLLYYFAFCFVALPLLLKDLYDLNWTERSFKGMNMLLHAFKRRVMKYEENVTWFSWVTFSDVIYYSTVISKSPPVACLIDIYFVHVLARQ